MKKWNFSAEFRRESALLVVEKNYTVADAVNAMNVGLSSMTRWVKQLRDEYASKTPKALYYAGANWDMWAEEKILTYWNVKNVTTLLMSDSLNNSR